MLATVVMMGVASFAIGCLPTHDQVGLLAPGLLVVLRVVQGFSAGAESAGASTLTVEHSPVGRRGFFKSFLMVGYAVGCSLAIIVFLPVALLPAEQLYSWGWRIPFWLSAVVVVTYYARHLDENPVFVRRGEGIKRSSEAAANLFVDTSTWLDLASRRDGHKWIVSLRQFVHQGSLRLLVPEVVREEFERNGPRAEQAMTTRLASIFHDAR